MYPLINNIDIIYHGIIFFLILYLLPTTIGYKFKNFLTFCRVAIENIKNAFI